MKIIDARLHIWTRVPQWRGFDTPQPSYGKVLIEGREHDMPPLSFVDSTSPPELAEIGAKVSGAALADRAKGPGHPDGPGHRADSEKMVKHLGGTTVLTEEAFTRYHKARQNGILWPETGCLRDR